MIKWYTCIKMCGCFWLYEWKLFVKRLISKFQGIGFQATKWWSSPCPVTPKSESPDWPLCCKYMTHGHEKCVCNLWRTLQMGSVHPYISDWLARTAKARYHIPWWHKSFCLSPSHHSIEYYWILSIFNRILYCDTAMVETEIEQGTSKVKNPYNGQTIPLLCCTFRALWFAGTDLGMYYTGLAIGYPCDFHWITVDSYRLDMADLLLSCNLSQYINSYGS